MGGAQQDVLYARGRPGRSPRQTCCAGGGQQRQQRQAERGAPSPRPPQRIGGGDLGHSKKRDGTPGRGRRCDGPGAGGGAMGNGAGPRRIRTCLLPIGLGPRYYSEITDDAASPAGKGRTGAPLPTASGPERAQRLFVERYGASLGPRREGAFALFFLARCCCFPVCIGAVSFAPAFFASRRCTLRSSAGSLILALQYT